MFHVQKADPIWLLVQELTIQPTLVRGSTYYAEFFEGLARGREVTL